MLRVTIGVVCLLFSYNSLQSQVIYIDNASKDAAFDSKLFSSSKQADIKLKAIPVSKVKLLPGLFYDRYLLNKKYIMSLENDKLLQNFYYEAGISKTGNITLNKDLNINDFYWGWESPSNQLRGHFLGHWMSAAAYLYAETKDEEVKAKLDKIVSELGECQLVNGGKWVGSIPEKYLELMVNGQNIWSPQYTIHKTLMGLYDTYALTGSKQALQIVENYADWFHEWTRKQIKNGKADAIYKGETSGMLEIWAELYGLNHQQKYLDLMESYGNPGMFKSLLKGEDALSLDHANASIPWSHGAAKVYEVTGNSYWKNVTQSFWRNAVLERESFATGGQNAGEHWIPKGKLPQFLGQNNQEHCTVYNMMRTADYLFRWTGDFSYADYIEKNLYNGILAQQHPNTGMVAYFLPMASGYTKGGEKGWGDPTKDFYCCHGSLVQAHVRYTENIYYEDANGLVVSQYIPSELTWEKNNSPVTIEQHFLGSEYNKDFDASRWTMKFKIQSEKENSFEIKFRVPSWLKEKPIVKVNGKIENVKVLNGSFVLSKAWKNDDISIEFPTKIYAEPLAQQSNLYAFMEGPIVLAGINASDTPLQGDTKNPSSLLHREHDQEYKNVKWKQSHYRTSGQKENVRFVPLYEIGDEKYTIYFPVNK